MTGTAGETSGEGYVRDGLDYYVEPEWTVDLLLDEEKFDGSIWDPACGSGTIIRACKKRRMAASGSDIAGRGYHRFDFLSPGRSWVSNIICNPPYVLAQEFAEKALTVANHKVALLVQAKFLFSQKRYPLFDRHPPARLYFLSTRPSMPPGDRYMAGTIEAKGGKTDFLWMVWCRDEHGPTTAHWLIRTP